MMFSLEERKQIINTFNSDDTEAIERMHGHLARKVVRFLKSNSVSIKQMDSIFISGLMMDNGAKAACFNAPYNRKRVREKTSCILCGSTSNLQNHHIKPKCDYPELKYDSSNIMVVCKDCHDIIHDDRKSNFYNERFYRMNYLKQKGLVCMEGK